MLRRMLWHSSTWVLVSVPRTSQVNQKKMRHDVMEAWTGDEDDVLLRLIEQYGTTWRVIAERIPSRTVSSIRNRYQRIVHGHREKGKNVCRRCGQMRRGHVCGRQEGYEDPTLFPEHLRAWCTIQVVNELGFHDVVHPPPTLYHFPFVTSLPPLAT